MRRAFAMFSSFNLSVIKLHSLFKGPNEYSHFKRQIWEKAEDFHLNWRIKFMFIKNKIRLVIKCEGQREGAYAKDHLGAIHVGGDHLLFNKTWLLTIATRVENSTLLCCLRYSALIKKYSQWRMSKDTGTFLQSHNRKQYLFQKHLYFPHF